MSKEYAVALSKIASIFDISEYDLPHDHQIVNFMEHNILESNPSWKDCFIMTLVCVKAIGDSWVDDVAEIDRTDKMVVFCKELKRFKNAGSVGKFHLEG